eukprot:TRINITY_DN24949_c0_g1_i1.p1 TRINITY_DN24949_c0_g1~~TRINITY_DN24949_c0_g1_i1.p1  ORF type:complete len:436 (+),score=81.59 TRINITY_DN24949_c0_g1_i1:92-1309(+)
MELEVLRTTGIPESGVISIRAGATRRQGQLSALDRPFQFPQNKRDVSTFKIDILDHLGTARLAVDLGPPRAEYRVKVEPVNEATDGPEMEVAFAIRDIEGRGDALRSVSDLTKVDPTGPPTFERMDANRDGVVTKEEYDAAVNEAKQDWEKRRESNARNYLEDHGLVQFMQFLMQSLMKDKPAEPYRFIQKQATLRLAQLRVAEQERGVEPVKTTLIQPSEDMLEQLAEMEQAAVETSNQLREDNLHLRGRAATLEAENKKILEENEKLRSSAATVITPVSEDTRQLREDNEQLRGRAAALEAEHRKVVEENEKLRSTGATMFPTTDASWTATLPPPVALDEACTEPLPGESPRSHAFREISLVQSDVSGLAKENTALIVELTRVRNEIESVRSRGNTPGAVKCS